MKKMYTWLIPVFALLFVVLMAGFGGGNGLKYSSGAPAGYTNSPGDGQNCSHCMGGSAVPVIDWITTDIPVTGYVPGATYTITVTVTGTGNKGFEVSPQDDMGNLIGTLTAGPETKLVGSDKYVTHNDASTADPKIWAFEWTAPDPGVGSVTFWGSMAVGKLNTKTTSATVNQSTVGIEQLAIQRMKLFPNPASDKVQVSWFATQNAPVQVDLYSLTGKHLETLIQGNGTAGENLFQANLGVEPGIYGLRIQVGDKVITKKLAVQ
jgi:hypothetical protein